MIDKREESLFLSSQKRAEWFKISLAPSVQSTQHFLGLRGMLSSPRMMDQGTIPATLTASGAVRIT